MPHVMKCHYEVLEVERNSDQDTLKKQYRKLALKVGYIYIYKTDQARLQHSTVMSCLVIYFCAEI